MIDDGIDLPMPDGRRTVLSWTSVKLRFPRLLLAALCPDKVTLTGALFSEDTHLMVEALKALGFTVIPDAAAGTLEVLDQVNGFKLLSKVHQSTPVCGAI